MSEEEEEEKHDPQWSRYRRQQAAARKGAGGGGSGGGGGRKRRGAWTAAAQRCVGSYIVCVDCFWLSCRLKKNDEFASHVLEASVVLLFLGVCLAIASPLPMGAGCSRNALWGVDRRMFQNIPQQVRHSCYNRADFCASAPTFPFLSWCL